MTKFGRRLKMQKDEGKKRPSSMMLDLYFRENGPRTQTSTSIRKNIYKHILIYRIIIRHESQEEEEQQK